MKIVVVGAGGVGGYFGGRLAHSGIDTTFLVRGATLEALRTNGLRVESIKGDFVVHPVRATDDAGSIGPADAVIVATKAWQITEAAHQILPLIGPETIVVPLENGVEAPAQLAGIVGAEHVLGGLCGIISFIVAPGHIRHAGFDPLVVFGELDNRVSPRAERLRDAFLSAGVLAEIPQDIHRAMWTKFLFITTYSGIGAVTRLPLGSWRTVPEIRSLATGALEEVIAVASSRGIVLDDRAVEMTMARYDALPSESTTSLQRDITDGRLSELDAQLGAVVRMGREGGVATPIMQTLYALLLPFENLARSKSV